MPRCPHCQKPVDEEQSFCPYCGKALQQDAPDGNAPAAAESPLPESPRSPVTAEPPAGAAAEPPAGAAPTVADGAPAAAVPAPVESAGAPEPATAPVPTGAKKPRARRKPAVIAAVVVAIALVAAVGGYAYFDYQRGVTYEHSLALAEQGDYAAAYEGFASLGDYEDAADQAEFCDNTLSYQKAEDLLDKGDYRAARTAFASLGSFSDARSQVAVCDAWQAFDEAKALADAGDYEAAAQRAEDFAGVSAVENDEEVAEWSNGNDYRLAAQLFDAGKFYEAYSAFKALGSYRDAAARAEACVQPAPASSELYHNKDFVSSSTDIVFDATPASHAVFIKVFSGDTHVSSVFVNPGTSVTIQVPAGTYTFKKAQGERWFGTDDLFGKDGDYRVLLFNGSDESVRIDDNKIYTITLEYKGGGNVGDRSVDAF